MTEIEAKKGSVKAFTAFGKQLIAQSHYDSVNIKEKLESLNSDVAAIDKLNLTSNHMMHFTF
jgi:hypothetical protein